jgi:hypothetical protein
LSLPSKLAENSDTMLNILAWISIFYDNWKNEYSRTSLIRNNWEFQKSCPDEAFRLTDYSEFLHQNVKDTICPDKGLLLRYK